MLSAITTLVSVVKSFVVFLLPVLIIPIILVVLIPIIYRIFSPSFVGYFTDSIGYLNSFIGTTGTNIILTLLGLVMFLFFFRFIMRIITSRK